MMMKRREERGLSKIERKTDNDNSKTEQQWNKER